MPNQLREARPVEGIPVSNRERIHLDVPLSGMDLAHNEQDPARQHRTNWEEEIEDRTIAAALRRLSISKGGIMSTTSPTAKTQEWVNISELIARDRPRQKHPAQMI